MDDDRRIEASFVNLAMLGSAIAGTFTVTYGQGSWGRSGWDVLWEISKG